MKNFLTKIKDLIFPQHIKCIFCDNELSNRSKNETCEICLKTLPFISNPCPRCGNPLNNEIDGVCFDCSANNYSFKLARSIFVYEGKVASLVQHIKFDKQIYLVEPATNYLLEELNKMQIVPDFITDIPMFTEKLKSRGFNQSEMFCKNLSSKSGVPFLELCEKVKNTPSQVSLSFKERKQNLIGAFKLKKEFKKTIKGKNILIVDDVFTTGATSNEISKVLINNGAKACYVLTLAHSVVEKDL